MTDNKWKPSRRELVSAILYQVLECAKTNNEESIDGTLMTKMFDDFLENQDPNEYIFSYKVDQYGKSVWVVELGSQGKVLLRSLIDHASNIMSLPKEFYEDKPQED